MSTSHSHNPLISALALALVTSLLAGCGSGEKQGGSAESGGSRDLSGALQQTSSTGAPATPAQPDDQSAEQPQNSGQATDFAPVEVNLAGGGFARSTPRTTHVPSDFMIIITARADGAGPYRLSVVSPRTAQTFKIPANDTMKITIDSLKAGQEAKLIVGDQTRRVAADAEPGP